MLVAAGKAADAPKPEASEATEAGKKEKKPKAKAKPKAQATAAEASAPKRPAKAKGRDRLMQIRNTTSRERSILLRSSSEHIVAEPGAISQIVRPRLERVCASPSDSTGAALILLVYSGFFGVCDLAFNSLMGFGVHAFGVYRSLDCSVKC